MNESWLNWLSVSLVVLALCLLQGCSSFPAEDAIAFCASQAEKTMAAVPSPDQIPSSVPSGSDSWVFAKYGSWTCGFWPGELWYLYESTGEKKWKDAAIAATEPIMPIAYRKAGSHDMGFITMPSIGHAYRHTGDARYKAALESAADSLAVLYNPNVGTILSWPDMVEKMNWPHNTIIDNMLNLELLFWVAENCGRRDLYDIAFRHAEVTMAHQFRPDWSTYHVMVFDDKTGEYLFGRTHQGWKDESMWARGQAWAIYGFTMAYRFTKDERFLSTAEHAVKAYVDRLPEDYVPYWDFDAGEQMEDQPKDASAAAIVASALIELSTYAEDGSYYLDLSRKILDSLTNSYRAGGQCPAFLLHCVGHLPYGREVDSSISYADYYYLEALVRMKELK